MSEEQAMREADRTTEAIMPLLKGKGPAVQGVVLAELTARWLAGHAPDLREELLEVQVDAIRVMILECEAELLGEAGHPAGWGWEEEQP